MKLDQKTKTGRLDKLVASIGENDLDTVAIVPGANFYFVSGAHFHLMERPTVLFVRADGEMHAVIPELERSKWQSLAPDVDTVYWQDSDGYDDAFATVAKRFSAGRLGVEGQRMRFFEAEILRRSFAGCALVDANREIAGMRLCKDAAEIALLKKAIEISETALRETHEAVSIGMSEAEVRQKLSLALMDHGADGFAFEPIVLSGGASADPHGSTSHDRHLASGDPLLIDFGGAYGGYNADITRTVFVNTASDRHKAIYNAVLAANETGRAIARAGMSLHELDVTVTGKLREAGFEDLIVHKTGHGLGLDVHEAPQVMQGNMETTESGMVFTIEPGLYRQGEIGVRIEDNVVITPDGATSLTGYERQLTLVG